MLSVNSLSVEFAARPLFADASFVINDNDRVALTGKNGAGKSTMLKIIAGLQQPTSGSVSRSGDTTVGYLPQQMKLADSTTLLDEVRKVFDRALRRRAEMEEVSRKLGDRTDYASPEYNALIDRLEYLNERIAIEDSDNMEAEMERTLIGLGFSRDDFDRPTSEFSGGWRMRVELAKILLAHPDVLLLDEPTNHLDIESIQWLEQFLVQKAKAVILVSHDRAFIDNVTNRTIEISCGKIYDYKAKYSEYVVLRRERVEQQMRAYENQQKMIADIKDFVERFRYKPTKAVQVQSRLKQLEKIVPIEVDEVDTSHLRLKFPPAPRSGDFPLILDDVGKAYGDHQVFDHATFSLRRGEKIALVGKNGEGKSTLVKCIMGEISYTGTLKTGHNVKIGYFAQNQAQMLDGELTVFDTIDRVAVGDIRTRIRDILGAFMFGGEASDKKVKVLSGGEKSRLAMIKLLLEPVNLLILDEPTNHLDMKTKDILKDAIKAFDGTVIVVSHDREFLDGLVDKVYEVGGGRIRENIGGIYDFLAKHNAELAKLASTGKSRRQPQEKTVEKHGEPGAPEPPKQKARLSYAEQKEQERMIRRARKELEKAEEEVAAREEEQQAAEQLLAQGDASPEILGKYNAATKALENAMSLWELAQQEYDRIMQ